MTKVVAILAIFTLAFCFFIELRVNEAHAEMYSEGQWKNDTRKAQVSQAKSLEKIASELTRIRKSIERCK